MAKRRKRRGMGSTDVDPYYKRIQTSKRVSRERACEAKARKGQVCVHERIAKYNGSLRRGCKKVPFVKGAYVCSKKAAERGATDAPEAKRRKKSATKTKRRATKATTSKKNCVKFKRGTKRCFASRASAKKVAKAFGGRLLAAG